ncbi:MBL fold metallo-hydrolase [Solibacillus isronensis]|uniref:MBL fold metallo-hydrolase n=1 Tax=Solibacillus isronensis TaxID=412383 RepID=UPI0009A74502|nr:MBL fold metallo-hydrolase [Solibacillus isronensis]
MDKQMNYGDDYKFIPASSVKSGVSEELLPDLYVHTIQIANIIFYSSPDNNGFVLIDAGMPKSAQEIIDVAEKRYGKNAKPKAIILTHGHFDHVGAIIELVEHWQVPVFAHKLELPYLTGLENYPEPDPTVDSGLVAKMSPMFPNEAIDLGESVQELPPDGTVPFMEGFKWIHTPGHTPGHVSLFRERDGALIAGDAFVTVKQESLYKVFTQEKEVNGPPKYLTPDWAAAFESVKILAALNPSVAVTGHGVPMSGEELSEGLRKLVDKFDQIALPSNKK